MFYNSINNKLNLKKFIDIFLCGLSKNNDLFIPFYIPKFKKSYLKFLKKKNYIELSFIISKLFIFSIPENILYNILYKSYFDFNNNNVIKYKNFKNNIFLLDLNRGNSLSFKDIALKPLSLILKYISLYYENNISIFCSTSGDTGSSAISNFKKFNNFKIFIFHPFNMISEIQRKQMTTCLNNNIKNISIIGNFDVAQLLIKKIFENIKNIKNNFIISVNSINWFRIIMQIIYYAYISIHLFLNKKINFYIPTGNFGNALAAYIAKKMGFPINKIIVCTNDNCFINNFIQNNIIKYKNIKKTISPSIDISIPSNFKRIISNYYISKKKMNYINKAIYSNKIYNKYIISSIEYFYSKFKKVYDPHTITSISSIIKNKQKNCSIIVSTAYPIKFFFNIKKIILNLKINFNFKNIFFLKEKYKVFPQNFKMIINYIKNNL